MNPSGTSNFWITEENYFQLTGPSFWKINEVPQERLSQLPSPFNLEKTIGVYASCVDPRVIGAPEGQKIAGIEWLRLEANPQPSEPPLNVHNFIIGGLVSGRFPVFGPYRVHFAWQIVCPWDIRLETFPEGRLFQIRMPMISQNSGTPKVRYSFSTRLVFRSSHAHFQFAAFRRVTGILLGLTTMVISAINWKIGWL